MCAAREAEHDAYGKIQTTCYFTKIKAGPARIRKIYREGIKAGVDGIQGQISLSVGWHYKDQYSTVINGDLSFVNPARSESEGRFAQQA